MSTITMTDSSKLQNLCDSLRNSREDSPQTRREIWDLSRKGMYNPATLAELTRSYYNGELPEWDEQKNNQCFVDKTHWNSFVNQCPVGDGFRAEIKSMVRWMRAQYELMDKNKSQYGETYLVGWALYHMPPPASEFLKWSLQGEEGDDSRCLWTIQGFEDHLTAWVFLFESPMAWSYASNAFQKEQELFKDRSITVFKESTFQIDQKLTGGGWVAHFLYSKPGHIRWAQQMWKTFWHRLWEDGAGTHGGLGINTDTIMTGM